MKIQKAILAQKINKLKGVVPKKPKQPVLQGILVQDGYLIANNMELTVKAKLEGTEGECFFIPERAFDLISNLPDGEIEITASEKNNIVIKADKIKNKYQTMDPETFPNVFPPEDGSELSIKADVLLESIKRVSYAVPQMASSAIMTSMCLQAAQGKLNFVGLDGHVMAWDKVDYEGEFELLIPQNTMDKLKSIGLLGDVQIKYNHSSAIFITDEFEIYTRLIEGKYFRYQSMFAELPLHTIVSRMDLLDAMTRAKMCTEERCPVKFEMSGNTLNLSIKDEKTDYQETIDLQEELSKDLKIGFNAKLVLETLKAFDSENVGIMFEGPEKPAIIESKNSDFKAIVLPVKIR